MTSWWLYRESRLGGAYALLFHLLDLGVGHVQVAHLRPNGKPVNLQLGNEGRETQPLGTSSG